MRYGRGSENGVWTLDKPWDHKEHGEPHCVGARVCENIEKPQHLPHGVGVPVDGGLWASTGTLPSCLLFATAPGTVLVKGLL